MLPDLVAYLQFSGEAIVRIMLAAVLGAMLGLERELNGHEAGLRTNIIITVSSCLFTYLGLEAFPLVGAARDPARVAAQIVSGVGFLGAGALLQTRNKIRGMTTAAAIWLAAAIGMGVGAGAYFAAAFTTLVALGVLSLLHPVSKRLEARAHRLKAQEEALQKIKNAPKKESEIEAGSDDLPEWREEDYD